MGKKVNNRFLMNNTKSMYELSIFCKSATRSELVSQCNVANYIKNKMKG
jgi:uncharacterized alpha/beta hydrolase family protein